MPHIAECATVSVPRQSRMKVCCTKLDSVDVICLDAASKFAEVACKRGDRTFCLGISLSSGTPKKETTSGNLDSEQVQ